MKMILAFLTALALCAAAQAPVVKKGSTPQPTQVQSQTTEQPAPVVKKGSLSQQGAEQLSVTIKKGSTELGKAAHTKKKKYKRNRFVKRMQP